MENNNNEYEDFDVIAPIRFKNKSNYQHIENIDEKYNFTDIFYNRNNNKKFHHYKSDKGKLRQIHFFFEVFAGSVITLSYILFAVIAMYTLTSNYLAKESLLNVDKYKASNIRCDDLNIPLSVQLQNKEICNIK